MRSLTPLVLAAALAGPIASTAVASPTSPLPWIEDDYAHAVAQAKAQHVPILLEAWAPW